MLSGTIPGAIVTQHYFMTNDMNVMPDLIRHPFRQGMGHDQDHGGGLAKTSD
jgi:hypothetical protein